MHFNAVGQFKRSINIVSAVMHQSIPAVPIPPPRANPRALAFFFFNGQVPRGGDT